MAIRNFNNTTALGTLSGPLASSATTVTVTGFTGTPAVPFTATIDRNTATEEIILVTAVAGGTLTVTRGYDSTAQQAHSAGATIEHTAGAIEYTEANQHVNATSGVHGTTGALVGAEGAQSIFDKTLISPVLQADATAGDAAVAYDPTGTRNLFRGVNVNGTDVITVDHAGSVNTVANLSVGGTAAIGGVLTANGGVSVPAGKKVTLTDAPAAGTDAVNKTYADTKASLAGDLGGTTTAPTVTSGAHHTHTSAQISDAASAATPSTVVIRDASGSAGFAYISIGNAAASGTDGVNKSYLDGRLSSNNTSVHSSATPSVASGASPLTVPFGVSANSFVTASNGTITVSKTGLYSIVLTNLSDAASAGLSLVTLSLPSGTVDDERQRASGYPGAGTLKQPLSWTGWLTAGQTFNVQISQTLTSPASVTYTCGLTIQFILG